jgi:putative transcriptional regulator
VRAFRLLAGLSWILALAAWGSPAPAMAEDSLTGQLLVATPRLTDPNFEHTVIYMLQHDGSGALGLVVNRPMGQVPLERLLAVIDGGEEVAPEDEAEEASTAPGDSLEVFYGGPVEPYRAFTLHSSDVMSEYSVAVDEETAFSVQADVLRALAEGGGPRHALFALGYSGWGAGQLESELERGDWFIVLPDQALIFSDDPAHIWEEAVARFSTEL